ncbi:hypothetical protein PBI_DEWDROP_148 [Microbacterium phage Dewdrop]|nr:hypothetical protein PBI_LEAF_148 [Microbacterium phage Leaf]QGZ17516.1 hypothetical protein PBI_DEWDROP_148 [Microbacterium phage Dewdrop]
MGSLEEVYKDTTLRKAEKLRSSVHAIQRDAEDESVWWCKGSTGSKYRVQVIDPGDTIDINPDLEASGVRVGDVVDGKRVIVPEADGMPFLSCTCPNGMNRGGRPQCYHTAAVLLILRDGTQEQHPVMTDPSPVNEDFLDDETAKALKSQGFTDTEIEFLRS